MAPFDNSLFLSIIFTLIEYCSLFYAFCVVFIFCPFVSRLKLSYNVFSKIRLIKYLLVLKKNS
jgi:hypothetical protein